MLGDDEKWQFRLITGLLKDLRITSLYVHLNLTALAFDLGAYLQRFAFFKRCQLGDAPRASGCFFSQPEQSSPCQTRPTPASQARLLNVSWSWLSVWSVPPATLAQPSRSRVSRQIPAMPLFVHSVKGPRKQSGRW